MLFLIHAAIGPVPSPFDCYLANRGLKTLHLRMRQHEVNAMAVARFLEKNPRVEKVVYPGETCILYKAVVNDKMVFGLVESLNFCHYSL